MPDASWLVWSKFSSFIALVAESSRVECNVILAHPGAHPPPNTHRPAGGAIPPGESSQESTCQPTTIYEHFTSFASIFIAYFLGRQMKRERERADFPSCLRVLGNCISFPAGFGLSLKVFPHEFQLTSLLNRVTPHFLCALQHCYFC